MLLAGTGRKSNRALHLMLLPGLFLTLVYFYGPMFGLVMSFQNFNPVKGFLRSEWVGLENFKYVFRMPDFSQAFWNTLYISILKIVFGILVPLILALLINEVSRKGFSKLVQTSIFIPYFLSWTILGSIVIEIFSLDGPVNSLLKLAGLEQTMFMTDNKWFPIIVVISDIWKGAGYYMIIYLAAITSIDQSLYEAAKVDGGGRWLQMLNITLPAMAPIIILTITLSLGGILNAGFEQILVLYNPIVYQSGDIIDTFVYRIGITNSQYSPAAAVGLFKSAISFVLVSLSYFLAYKFNDYRIF